ncbi:MAG: hypothetical protein KatS3mg061_2080 [Dehalococcoidia bacterium]|nr:MAG: hypothetical protein KatS3mg061_2080 [Dehalococcoidia bacterium]
MAPPETGDFGELLLSAPVARALREMGYREPTPIQREAIPPFLAGKDVVGRAKTGTGKTAAFGIPLAEKIDPRRPGVQALVLVPTRELARQVADDLGRIGRYRGLKVLPVYGGEAIGPQAQALERGVHVVVGTPGRVIDHLSRGTLHFREVRIVILDECDEMLDIGFAEDIETILRRTPKARQTGLFSATIPLFVRKLVWRYMKDPVFIEIDPDQPIVETIEQVYYEVAERDKLAALIEVLDRMTGEERILIFRRTQRGVDGLTRTMWDQGFHIQALHGGMKQSERNRVMTAFRSGDTAPFGRHECRRPWHRCRGDHPRHQLRLPRERRGVHPPDRSHGARRSAGHRDLLRRRVGPRRLRTDPRSGRRPPAPRPTPAVPFARPRWLSRSLKRGCRRIRRRPASCPPGCPRGRRALLAE